MNIKHIALIIIISAFSFQQPAACRAEEGPVAHFKDRIARVLDILHTPQQDGRDESEEKRRLIWELAQSTFDEEIILPRILKQTWPKLSLEEKAKLNRFMSFVIKWKFIGKLYKYGVKEIQYEKEGLKDGLYELEGTLGTGFFRHPVRFLFIKKEGQWAAYDIVIRGYSLIEHYRKKFDRTFDRRGFNGLIKHLEDELYEEWEEMGLKPAEGLAASEISNTP